VPDHDDASSANNPRGAAPILFGLTLLLFVGVVVAGMVSVAVGPVDKAALLSRAPVRGELSVRTVAPRSSTVITAAATATPPPAVGSGAPCVSASGALDDEALLGREFHGGETLTIAINYDVVGCSTVEASVFGYTAPDGPRYAYYCVQIQCHGELKAYTLVLQTPLEGASGQVSLAPVFGVFPPKDLSSPPDIEGFVLCGLLLNFSDGTFGGTYVHVAIGERCDDATSPLPVTPAADLSATPRPLLPRASAGLSTPTAGADRLPSLDPYAVEVLARRPDGPCGEADVAVDGDSPVGHRFSDGDRFVLPISYTAGCDAVVSWIFGYYLPDSPVYQARCPNGCGPFSRMNFYGARADLSPAGGVVDISPPPGPLAGTLSDKPTTLEGFVLCSAEIHLLVRGHTTASAEFRVGTVC
jgi:hypothetical protein